MDNTQNENYEIKEGVYEMKFQVFFSALDFDSAMTFLIRTRDSLLDHQDVLEVEPNSLVALGGDEK